MRDKNKRDKTREMEDKAEERRTQMWWKACVDRGDNKQQHLVSLVLSSHAKAEHTLQIVNQLTVCLNFLPWQFGF